MTNANELYPFERATLEISPAMIIPPIFTLTVFGETQSLGATIEIVNTHDTVNGYMIFEVLGKDTAAIGSIGYERNIGAQEIEGTKGVLIVGLNKEVKLDWNSATQLSKVDTVGLFHLNLITESGILGAPTLTLSLGVDTVNKKVTGVAEVYDNSLRDPVLCQSHVTGEMIYEVVMPPGHSAIRIDLTGYPEIHWPVYGGIGPVIPSNFTAVIVFDSEWNQGYVEYQHLTASGWQKASGTIGHPFLIANLTNAK